MVVIDGKEIGTNLDRSQARSGPVWLENMLSNKKRNIVPTSIPVEDMVSKCLGKNPKAKKSKTMSKIDFDVDSGNRVAEIAYPLTKEKTKSPTTQDFVVERIKIGTASRATYVLHLEASTKKIITRTWKDEKDKHQMKEMLRRMVEYIEAINDPNPQPLSQLPMSFDPKSPTN